ncbi:precorrin-6A synthase (deacetylating) [Mycolicibacter heraklionensis]|uniref:Precorrin-6A synthase (Deacetylating) n=1 Tax=Mycolicibacter heraklionensis TaxID=512402 RepID=A0A9X7WEP1_9MYCO|nr:precorrin-6A synthase (deacetylating) [Mycolicibacter heraklionensis]QZA06838.1 precorrin-6A synthase (deacetylating) [Mycolicibacter heraklionensis]
MKVWILGVGMGPAHVTAEVADALRSADYVVAPEKSSDDALLALRRAVVDAYAGTVPIVTVSDPRRDRSPGLTTAGYENAVADWHAERAARYAEVLRERGGTAAFLVWGDPALYDSTIRIVEQVKALGLELDYDVLPGISAPQLLAARHRIVLHEVGRPVHITTGRRLLEAVDEGQDNIVAMLNSELDLSAVADWTIWWGANLGATGERLISGRVADVADEIAAARGAARAEAGWVMDVFLVRRT